MPPACGRCRHPADPLAAPLAPRSVDSLKVYARLNPRAYEDLIRRASAQIDACVDMVAAGLAADEIEAAPLAPA